MKVCSSSKCKFSCAEINEETGSLREAMEWQQEGYRVHAEVNGTEIGF